MSKTPAIHLIGHGHIDPTWLWRWPEGCAEVRATFRSALERMKESPDIHFTATSACFYQWIKDCDPQLFAEIRERVAQGRWEIAGGWWIEPDCNIPGGEALIRQALYGLQFFEEEFGLHVPVAFNPDSFGHAGTLPQILQLMGQDYYCYQRPEPGNEMDYPEGTTFRWRALDGSEVLATNLLESYNGEDDILLDRLQRLPNSPHLTQGQSEILAFYGVGDHGGGPTKRAIEIIKDNQAALKLHFSTLLHYFEALEKSNQQWPVIDHDLQYHARGCYSVHAEIKRLNRQTEHALMAAERWAAATWLTLDRPYPHAALDAAWKDLLYNQFHDIIAGTSIETAYTDARNQLGRALQTAEEIQNNARQSLAAAIDTQAEGTAVIVFNPLPWPVKTIVTLPHIATRELQPPHHLVDHENTVLPIQTVNGDRVGHEVKTFTAELPGLGYRTYFLRAGFARAKSERRLEAGEHFLENDWWRIEIDPQDGTIRRLLDVQQNVEVLTLGNVLAVLSDSSDAWSHGVRAYRIEDGRFAAARVTLHENGPVRATIRIESRFANSCAEQRITLYRGADHIDCAFRVNWQERYRMLKLAYVLNIDHGHATCDTPYGYHERPTDGSEQPCQRWTDLSGLFQGKTYGFALLNDSKYGFDVQRDTLRLSILRGPAYAHHDPDPISAADPWPIIDQGWHRFAVRLFPHPGPWQKTDLARRAWSFNEPPTVLVEHAHPGHLPRAASILECNSPSFVCSVVKQTPDGQHLTVRGYESTGAESPVNLVSSVNHATLATTVNPHQIKTLQIDKSFSNLSDIIVRKS